MRYERKISRKIYEPIKLTDDTRRININEELDNLIEQKIAIHFIRGQRLDGYFM
jgi:hypothetical protein